MLSLNEELFLNTNFYTYFFKKKIHALKNVYIYVSGPTNLKYIGDNKNEQMCQEVIPFKLGFDSVDSVFQ